MKIEYGDISRKAELGDTVALKNQEQEVVKCEETGVLMLNIDADQLAVGDLRFIKQLGLTISNPDTDRPVALGVDLKEDSFGEKVSRFLSSVETDNDDDSGFFGSSSGLFGGGSSFGGFGGFGGGSFSGGGASRGF